MIFLLLKSSPEERKECLFCLSYVSQMLAQIEINLSLFNPTIFHREYLSNYPVAIKEDK